MAKVKRILTELVEVSIEDLRDLLAATDVDEDTAPRPELDRLDAMQTTIEIHEHSPAELRISMLKADLLWLVDAGSAAGPRELPPSVDATHVRIPTAKLTVLLDSFTSRANAAGAEKDHHRALSRCLELRPSPAMQTVDCLVRHEVIGWAKLQAEKQKAKLRRTAPPATVSERGRREGGKEGGGEKPK